MWAVALTLGTCGLTKRQRLSGDARRTQLIEAAAPLILEQGHLPLSLDRLASSIGASKALIYTYFPTQHELFNAVLEKGFAELGATGIADLACGSASLADAALRAARIYYRHVARNGPILHVILRDLYMSRALSPEAAAARDRMVTPLVRLIRRELRLNANEAVAAFNLAVTLPEETGRLAWQGIIELDRGEALLDQLMASTLKALRPA